jgi:hypothetical protein
MQHGSSRARKPRDSASSLADLQQKYGAIVNKPGNLLRPEFALL